MTKVVLTGSALAAATLVIGAVVRRRRAAGNDTSPGAELGIEDDDAGFAIVEEGVEVTEIGLADVDPQGLDLDTNAAAHGGVIEQRERSPEPGKTIP